MMVIQNAFKVFVCGLPHPSSMVVAAGRHPPMIFVFASASSYLNSILVLSAPIQALC